MMVAAVQNDIKLQSVAWDETRHAGLLSISESGEPVEYLKEHIESKNLLLYDVLAGDTLLGVIVARVEILSNKQQELVIIAAKSCGKHAGFVPLATELVRRLAAAGQIPSVRIHTTNNKVAHLLAKSGWQEIERVHRIKAYGK